MYVLGRYFSALCFLGMGFGLNACSAAGAGAADGSHAGADGLSVNPNQGPDRDGSGGSSTSKPGLSDMVPDDDDGDVPPPGGGGTGGNGGSGDPCACTCGHNPLPGVTLDTIDGVLHVVLDVADVANAAADVTLHISGAGAGCKPTNGGIELTGNVAVDLGAGAGLPLLGAHLAVSIGNAPGIVAVNGTAMVGASGLPALDLPDADLEANVALDLRSADGPQLDLTLHPAQVGLNLSNLTLAGDSMQLVESTVNVSTTKGGDLIQVQGILGSDAQAPWISTVPLSPIGSSSVTAWLAGDSVAKLNISGDLQLRGTSLVSGLVPLAVVNLNDAALSWDESGITVAAQVDAQLHPLVSAAANADLHLLLSREAWEIKLCADVALSLGGNALQPLQCLDMTDGGVAVCDQ